MLIAKIKVLLCVVVVCLCAAGEDTTAAMFRGGPSHSGVYAASGGPRALTPKWKFHTDGRIIGSATVADGKVFFGSFDQNLYAVDEQTGALKWKYETDGVITSTPAVANGILYFGSYDGGFYALDSATGKLRWKWKTAGERRFAARHIHGFNPEAEILPDYWDFYLSSPAIWQGKVYFGSGDGNVYALDAATGQLVWSFRTDNVVHSSPAVADGMVFVGSFDTYFYAIDAISGEEKWHFKTGEDRDIHNQEGITSSPAVADGVVYFGCRNATVYALQAATGKQLWAHQNHRGWVTNSPAVSGGRVYSATGSDKMLFVLDAKDGSVIHSQLVNAGTFASPAISGDILYLATFDDKLRAFNLKTNEETLAFATSSPQEEAEHAASQTVNLKYNFYDDALGVMMKRFASGVFLSSPVVSQGVVFIGSTDGNMYALQ